MPDAFDPSRESVVWVADTGLFVAAGREQNSKYTALEQFARHHGLTLVIPQRVYEELGGAPERSTPEQLPIDSAIESGWVTVADEPDYTNSTVAKVMDDVRSSIARVSGRDEDQIEKTDTALAAVAAEALEREQADVATIVTTDINAGKGVVEALERHGFEGRVQFKNGFDLLDEIT